MTKTFDEIVDEMVKQALEDCKDTFVSEVDELSPRECVIAFTNATANELYSYHHSLGRDIRNNYGLWEEGATGDEHPDDYSFRIIQAIQEKLKSMEL